MRKFLLFTLLFVLSATPIYSQYTIYEVQGNVMQKLGRENVQVKKLQNLLATDFIVLSENAKLVLLDVEGSVRVILDEPMAGSVSTLVADNTKGVMNLTFTYLSYLVDRLMKSGKSNHIKSFGGNTYRGPEADSLATEETIVHEDLSEDWMKTVDSLQLIMKTKKASQENK